MNFLVDGEYFFINKMYKTIYYEEFSNIYILYKNKFL